MATRRRHLGARAWRARLPRKTKKSFGNLNVSATGTQRSDGLVPTEQLRNGNSSSTRAPSGDESVVQTKEKQGGTNGTAAIQRTRAQPGAETPSSGFAALALGQEDEGDEITASVDDDTKLDWQTKTPNKNIRQLRIYAFAARLRWELFLIDNPISYPNSQIDESIRSARRRSLGDYVRQQSLTFGPVFIKIFQLAGARVDLLPVEFVERLSKLQDKVPSMDEQSVRETFREEFGKHPEAAFDTFDWRPIASASLSQVHRARLNGNDVVVKVQRKGLKQLFDIDLEALSRVAKAFDLRNRTNDFTRIYEECASVLLGEIDFVAEGENADMFRRNFASDISIPRVYWRYTSRRVITLSYLPGTKITDVQTLQSKGFDTAELAQKLVAVYFESFWAGFFQADPHPGNIAVDDSGNLVFYDFGMVNCLKPGLNSRLKELFRAVYNKDAKQTLELLIELEIVVGGSVDKQSLQRAIAYFLNRIGEQASNRSPVSVIGDELFSIATDSPVRFPSQFVFLLRALSTLEGVGKALYPDFSIAGAAQPYATRLLTEENSQSGLAETVTEQVTSLSSAISQVPNRVQRVERILAEIESGELKPKARVVESEIALRRASIMQVATIEAVACMGLVNLGIELSSTTSVSPLVPNLFFLTSTALAGSFAWAIRRVRRIDDFRRRSMGGSMEEE